MQGEMKGKRFPWFKSSNLHLNGSLFLKKKIDLIMPTQSVHTMKENPVHSFLCLILIFKGRNCVLGY